MKHIVAKGGDGIAGNGPSAFDNRRFVCLSEIGAFKANLLALVPMHIVPWQHLSGKNNNQMIDPAIALPIKPAGL